MWESVVSSPQLTGKNKGDQNSCFTRDGGAGVGVEKRGGVRLGNLVLVVRRWMVYTGIRTGTLTTETEKHIRGVTDFG